MFQSRIRASAAAVVSGTATGTSAWAIVDARNTTAIQASKVLPEIVRSHAGDFSANGSFVIASTSVSDVVDGPPQRSQAPTVSDTNEPNDNCLSGMGHSYKETLTTIGSGGRNPKRRASLCAAMELAAELE